MAMATITEHPRGRFNVECDEVEMSLIRQATADAARKEHLIKEEQQALKRLNEDFAMVRPVAASATW